MATRATPIDDDHRPRSITARVLAPLALIACGAAVFALVTSSLSDDGDGANPERDRTAREQRQGSNQPELTGKAYTVVPGDTFSGIAERAGMPVQRLERLNPDVDVTALNAGQVLKLKR